MHFTVLVLLLYISYGFCQKDCLQNDLQTRTTTADTVANSTHTASTSNNNTSDFKQATVEIQIDGSDGSTVINLTPAMHFSTVSPTRSHKASGKSSASSNHLTTVLRSSIYHTDLNIQSPSISVLPTPTANLTGPSGIKWTFSLPQVTSTLASVGLSTTSGGSSIFIRIFSLLLCGGLPVAVILVA